MLHKPCMSVKSQHITELVQDKNQRKLAIILAIPQIISGAVFMNQVGSLNSVVMSSCKILLGFTTERLPPTEDHTLPDRFSLGLVSPFAVPDFTHLPVFTMLADQSGGSPYG